MKKSLFITGLALVLVLGLGLIAVGSNMGFKLNKTLVGGDVSNWVSLPFNNQFNDGSGTDDALELYNDTGATVVGRYNSGTQAYELYNGGRGSINFAITMGEGYYIQKGTGGTWVVVGSHDPSYAIPLVGGDVSNWVSVPYHTKLTDATGLFTETSATVVGRYNSTTQAYELYNGGRGSINFALTAGEGYYVQVGTGAPWTPTHY